MRESCRLVDRLVIRILMRCAWLCNAVLVIYSAIWACTDSIVGLVLVLIMRDSGGNVFGWLPFVEILTASLRV